MRTGVIVAGGRSRRFGEREKAMAEFDGKPLIRRVADTVSTVVDELVVNCRVEQVESLRRVLGDTPYDLQFAIDDVPDRGPVAGMATALGVANAPLAVVTACDMPTLDAAFLGSMFDDAAGRSGAVPVFEGYRQPLCAVYRVNPARDACRAVLATDADSLRAMLDCLDPVAIPEEEVRTRTDTTTFRNVNT